MNVYIYDSFLNHNKYKRILFRIETRLTDLGLNGKIYRIGPMQNINNAISQESRVNTSSITVVGDNSTLSQLINGLKNYEIPIGIIPIGDNNSIAESLGIEAEEAACDTLSFRRIKNLDLGIANNFYFLSQANITTENSRIEIDQNYTIEITKKGIISIINLASPDQTLPHSQKTDPQDGNLELVITTKESKKIILPAAKKIDQSLFKFNKLTIFNKKHPITLDDTIKIPGPIELGIDKKKIKIIVGKNRNF